MSADGATTTGRTRRGRRPPRTSGEDRRRALLSTAEQLLAERGPDAISVDDIARGAGISRPTFYFHFASKDEVLLALLDQVVEETDAGITAAGADHASDPAEGFRRCIAAFVEVFTAHRPVTAVVYARAGNPELRRLWADALQRWVDSVAGKIEDERRAGRVSTPIPSAELATTLILTNERILIGAFAGDGPAVPAASITEVLHRVWLCSIYGDEPTPGHPEASV